MRLPPWTLLLVGSVVACGPPAHLATADDAVQMAPSEQREELSASLAELAADPKADDVRAELGRAQDWLERAEQLNTAEEEPARVRLLLQAVEAQLGAIKAHYARARAEQSFAALRKRVEDQ